VKNYLGVEGVREEASAIVVNRRSGLIARGLNAKNQHDFQVFS